MMGAGANRTITWTDRSVYIPDGNNGYVDYINGVARSGNTFIAVGQKATIMRSTNGATWTRISPPAGTSASLEYLSVTYDSTNNRFVAISATTIMYSNNDGVTWSNAVTGQTNQVSIHYANNVYVIVGDSALIKTSSDGIAWTSRSAPAGVTESFTSVTWGNPSGSGAPGRWVAVGGSSNSRYIYSNDSGVTWINIANNTTESIRKIIWAGAPINLYVVVGNTISTGAPFIRTNAAGNAAFSTVYTATASIGEQSAYSLHYTGSTLLIGGEKGQLVTSTNGTAFTVQRNSPAAANLVGDITIYGIEYSSSLGRYVFVGNQIQYATGFTRSTATIVYSSNSRILSSTYASGISGGLYVFSTSNSAIVFTTTTLTSITGYYLPAAAADVSFSGFALITDGTRVIVGGSAENGKPRVIYSTTDGVNWAENFSSATAGLTILAGMYGSQMDTPGPGIGKYTFVGIGDHVVYSSDGVNWTAGTQPLSSNYYAMYYTEDPLYGFAFGLAGGSVNKLETFFSASGLWGNVGPVPTVNTGGSTRIMRSIEYRRSPTNLNSSRYFFALDGPASGGYLITTPYDWTTWTNLTMAEANTFIRSFAIEPPNGMLIAAGYKFISSKYYPSVQMTVDGVTFKSTNVPSYEGELYTAVYSPSYFVVAGTKGIILITAS